VSVVAVAADSDFPLANIPFGVVATSDGRERVATIVGDVVVDLAALHRAGLLPPALPDGVFDTRALNRFMALGPSATHAVRTRVAELLGADGDLDAVRAALLEREAVAPRLPFQVGDYVDFYSSLEHATNMGRILRPGTEPLPENWRHLPVGYHGRAGTVVVSGTPVTRPNGQRRGEGGAVDAGPSRRLDFELEVGFVIGPASTRGRRVKTVDAAQHVFGFVLVNDWSARDVQAFEYQPLGPFLGKSFATSISPWVVTLDALRPYFVAPPVQEPPVEPYLRTDEPWAIDLELEVDIAPRGKTATTVTRTNFASMYWTAPQQLAHLTVNGATVRTGDLCASGTVSGAAPGSRGSLMEATWGGTDPLPLADGTTRTFLEDGDEVVMRGWCGGGRGTPRVGFGDVRGAVVPAPPLTSAP
jgi:fumarylacetoacetase